MTPRLVAAWTFESGPVPDFATFGARLDIARREFDRLGQPAAFLFHCLGGRGPNGEMRWDNVERAAVENPHLRPASLHPWLKSLVKGGAWVCEYIGNIHTTELLALPARAKADNSMLDVLSPFRRAGECEINLGVDASALFDVTSPDYGAYLLGSHFLAARNCQTYVESRPQDVTWWLKGPCIAAEGDWQWQNSVGGFRAAQSQDIRWPMMPDGGWNDPGAGASLVKQAREILAEGQCVAVALDSDQWQGAKPGREEIGL